MGYHVLMPLNRQIIWKVYVSCPPFLEICELLDHFTLLHLGGSRNHPFIRHDHIHMCAQIHFSHTPIYTHTSCLTIRSLSLADLGYVCGPMLSNAPWGEVCWDASWRYFSALKRCCKRPNLSAFAYCPVWIWESEMSQSSLVQYGSTTQMKVIMARELHAATFYFVYNTDQYQHWHMSNLYRIVKNQSWNVHLFFGCKIKDWSVMLHKHSLTLYFKHCARSLKDTEMIYTGAQQYRGVT